jgi:xanthine dehydrogenase accessory factor
MLLIVTESSGSSPGRKGFKMAVTDDDLCGSIGGGVMEVNLVEQARQSLSGQQDDAIENSNSYIKHQVHQKNAAESSGMICSGKQAVVFFKLGLSHLETVAEIIEALEKNERKILRITPDEFSLKKPHEGETKNAGGTQHYSRVQNSHDFFYEETLGYKNKLFIVGGGHCALALSELMAKMDFHISLFDDRPNLNTLDKNKYVHEKNVIGSYANIDEVITSGEDKFVVVMTLGYKSDEIVVRKLLAKEFRYFGVLGSKAKMAVLLRDLQNEGFAKEKLDRIHTPIGLPINSQTPEEIAISIAAEIIAVKNSAN